LSSEYSPPSQIEDINGLKGVNSTVIENRLRQYEQLGIHRTGLPGDDATTEWLASELSNLGVEPIVQSYTFPRFEYKTAELRADDIHVTGIPMFDGGVTGPTGVEGELADDSEEDLFGKIVIANSAIRKDMRWMDPHAKGHYESIAQRGAVGVIVPTGDPEGEIVLRNAESIRDPFQLPILQVEPSHVKRLRSQLIIGGSAILKIDGHRLSSTATNILANLKPADNGDRPGIGVMTPKSGWFTCAAERGGGLAAWLAIAEAMNEWSERPSSFHFSATGGHELGHQGLIHHLKTSKSDENGMSHPAHTWLHLGASIGAKHVDAMRGPNVIEGKKRGARLSASSQSLMTLAESAMNEAAINPFEYFPEPVGTQVGGEARDIASRGGKFISFRGGHHYFHSPQDTVDIAVDAEKISRWAIAAIKVASRLAEQMKN
jgi:hypothetical protein